MPRGRAGTVARRVVRGQRLVVAVIALSLTACVALPDARNTAPLPPPAPASQPPGAPATPSRDEPTLDRLPEAGGVTPATGTVVSPADDIWLHLRQELRLPTHADRPEVRAAMRAYARDRDIGRVFEGRGITLLPMLVAEARAQDVPVELAFLPFVESKLNPTASNAGNVGMWQFQASTARLMGLQTGPGIDERKDPVRATRAAYSYLRRLQRIFDGDWMLALAAYNIGDGRLRQLVASSGTRDVWRLPLPAHCRAHMARLAALWEIARDPEGAGIRIPPIADDLSVERISLDRALSLTDVARIHGVDREELGLLNAHLGGGVVRGGATVWLPRRRAGSPASGGAALASGEIASPVGERELGDSTYRVRSGDSLYSIARRFATTVSRLKQENGLRSDALRVGMELRVPQGH